MVTTYYYLDQQSVMLRTIVEVTADGCFLLHLCVPSQIVLLGPTNMLRSSYNQSKQVRIIVHEVYHSVREG